MKNYNMPTELPNGKIQTTTILRFPEGSTITQVDEHAISVTQIADELGELFDKRFCEELEKTIGRVPAQIWLEDAAERILKELLLKQIR